MIRILELRYQKLDTGILQMPGMTPRGLRENASTVGLYLGLSSDPLDFLRSDIKYLPCWLFLSVCK